MNPRSAMLVALLAGGFLSSQPGAPPPTAPSGTHKKPQTPAAVSNIVDYSRKLEVEDWPRETLHEFLSTASDAKEESEKLVCPLKGNFKFNFLVATVPDPQNSHYPYMFDRFVESIERAASDYRPPQPPPPPAPVTEDLVATPPPARAAESRAATGYSLDRFWLPWDTEDAPADTDWLKREQYSDWQQRKQNYPGILVFRRGNDEVLAVLLVGENPVGGINKGQFQNALQLIGHFTGGRVRKVGILGPSFSGSVHSLGIAMQSLSPGLVNDGGPVESYTVITGSATGPDNERTLTGYGGNGKDGKPVITYSATIENDGVALKSFLHYLADKTNHSGRVAILVERGSGYANQFVNSGEKDRKDIRPLILRYPMEISRLRNAYEEDAQLSALSTHNAGAPHDGLSLTLKDSHPAEDSLPAFSPDLSSVSQESALMTTLSVITRQRIDYVGIVASDVLDSIFLGRMLKKYCPDLRLFLFDSDQVYAGVAQNRAFLGMMMITTYPLYPANQLWTGSWNASRPLSVFSNNTSEGVYNACLRLLTHDAPSVPLAEYAPPQWHPSTAAPPGPTSASPALWLTVVGHNALWPLTTLHVDKNLSSTTSVWQPLSKTQLAHMTPMSWDFALYIVTALSAAFACLIWQLNRVPDDGQYVQRGWLSMFALVRGHATIRLFVTFTTVSLLAAAMFIGAVQIKYQAWHGVLASSSGLDGSLVSWLQAAFAVLGPAILLATMVYLWQPPGRWWYAIAPACVAVSAGFFLLVYFGKGPSLTYIYRSVHLGDGVSPIVPALLLAAALFWYSCAHLNRIRLCRFAPAELPEFTGDVFLGGAGDPVQGNVREACEKMREALERIWFGKWCSWAASVWIVSAGLWLLTGTQVRSLEGRGFERLYTAGLFTIYGSLLFACARFVHIWLGLRDILHRLEQHPLRIALKRLGKLKDLSPARVWRVGGSRRTDMTVAHALDLLGTLSVRSDFDYAAQRETLEGCARLVVAADSCRRPVQKWLLGAINDTLLTVSTHLSSEGAPRAMAAAAGGSTASAAPAAPALDPAVENAAQDFVALQFAAWIRYVAMHMKSLLEFVAAGLMLAIASLMSYPFEPHHLIMTVISACFFAISAVFLFAFVQLNRNTVISYLNDTKPGKIDSNLLHVASFGALPLVTVLSAQFPSIGGFLFAWVKPALESMR